MNVMVAHVAQQHSYRLASALKSGGMLACYATTVYYQKHSWTGAIAKYLPRYYRAKAQNRRCEALEDYEVIQFCEWQGLIKLLAMNTRIFHKKYDKIKYRTADHFAKKAAEWAIQHKVDAVVTYDNTSPILFETLEREAPEILRIMDVSAADPSFMEPIYDRDRFLAPAFWPLLKYERRVVWNPITRARTARERRATQRFLVPSEFVERSLKHAGIDDDRISICPYGVDADMFSPKTYKTVNNRPLQCVFVGGAKELKGISYLLEAFRSISSSQARLTVVGEVNMESDLIKPYCDKVRFTGPVLHSEIPNLLREADLYVFPSLGEGQSLSVLEAAACGLPLIVSENSGVREHVSNGKEGFVIPIQSSASIVEKVLWFVNHPEQLEIMGKNAREMVLKLTWEQYDLRILDIFHSFEASKKAE